MRPLALVAFLCLAACGDAVTLDRAASVASSEDVEQELQAYLEAARVEVASVSCAEVASAPSSKVGAVVRTDACTVEPPAGAPFTMDVEHVNAVNADGEPTITWSETHPTVVLVPMIEDWLTQSHSADRGAPVTATCDAPSVVPATPGDAFDCALGGAADEGAIRATIAEGGAVGFEVLG